MKTIKEMQIEAEKKYYKERSITKEEFMELMKEYEARLLETQEEEKILAETLDNKLKKVQILNK